MTLTQIKRDVARGYKEAMTRRGLPEFTSDTGLSSDASLQTPQPAQPRQPRQKRSGLHREDYAYKPDTEVGRVLYALRPIRTQSEVAEMLGISTRYVSYLEYKAVEKILRAFRPLVREEENIR